MERVHHAVLELLAMSLSHRFAQARGLQLVRQVRSSTHQTQTIWLPIAARAVSKAAAGAGRVATARATERGRERLADVLDICARPWASVQR